MIKNNFIEVDGELIENMFDLGVFLNDLTLLMKKHNVKSLTNLNITPIKIELIDTISFENTKITLKNHRTPRPRW